MAYRFHPVIPADLEEGTTSPVRIRFSARDEEKDCVEGNTKKKCTYSRSMTAAGLFFMASALCLVFTTNQAASAIPTTAETVQWINDMYSLVGAIVVAGCICLLHDKEEGKRIMAGRAGMAIFMGFVGPWFVSWLPSEWSISNYKGLVMIGGFFGGVGYVLSRTVVERLFTRAPKISEKLVQYGEDRLEKKFKK